MNSQTSPSADDFIFAPDETRPGWLSWELRGNDRYNSTLGKMWAQKRDDGMVVVRTEPAHLQGNLANSVHGGAILTQVDIALFVCARLNGVLDQGPGVTLDLNTHFIGAGRVGRPLDAEVELLRETGRLAFLRGLVVQDGETICAFTGTIRKSSGRSTASTR